MRLNNGRYTVDTDEAELLATSPLLRCGDGYGHETDRRYSAWKSLKTGKFFITMEYTEYITGFFGKKKNEVSGVTLIDVYDQSELIERMRKHSIQTPVDMLERV
jgi:hypothetical protein